MGAAAASVCAAAPLVATVLMFPFVGLVASADRAIVHDEPLATLVADLERRGIHEAYGPYWTAYKATFLAEERVVVAPLAGWDRYPAYTARVDRAPREAYIFNTGDPELGRDQQEEARNAYQRFEARLAAGEIAYERRDYGFFRLYAAAEPRRLLPPPDRRPIVALARPAATLRLLDPPSRLEPGQTTRVRVQVTNASDGFWSADGFPRLAGSHRVSASFRWLAPDGTAAVVEGVRTPLPHDVQVGETARLAVLVEAPAAAGSYNLRVTLVQENVAWFDQATGSQATCRIDVR